jgi:acyl carrier protein
MNERLRAVIAETLDLPLSQIKPETARAETEAWDSLAHLRLITAIEAEFSVAFTMEQIAELQTFDDLQQFVDSRCLQRSTA